MSRRLEIATDAIPKIDSIEREIEDSFNDPKTGHLRSRAFTDHIYLLIAHRDFRVTGQRAERKRLLSVNYGINRRIERCGEYADAFHYIEDKIASHEKAFNDYYYFSYKTGSPMLPDEVHVIDRRIRRLIGIKEKLYKMRRGFNI